MRREPPTLKSSTYVPVERKRLRADPQGTPFELIGAEKRHIAPERSVAAHLAMGRIEISVTSAVRGRAMEATTIAATSSGWSRRSGW